MSKPRLGVYKFTSCDGCQLAFLNAGEALLVLSDLVDMVHFAEAGAVDEDAQVDIAFVEGSISTPDHLERIKKIREHSKYLITLGACATSGGIQALRNYADTQDWVAAIYASPETIKTLPFSTPIATHVKVDWELWGCPVNSKQVIDVIRSLLSNASPRITRESVCIECKRQGNTCVLVSQKIACLGPVTQTGCGALCPTVGRGCYGCYGPQENSNPVALGNLFLSQGASPESITQRFLHINNQAPAFKAAGNYFKGIKIVKE